MLPQDDYSLDRGLNGERQNSLGSRSNDESWSSLLGDNSPARIEAHRSSPGVRFAEDDAITADATAESSEGPKLYVAVMEAVGLVVKPGVKVCSKQHKLEAPYQVLCG